MLKEKIKRTIRYSLVVGSFLLVVSIATQVKMGTALAEEVCYTNDFGKKDDVVFSAAGRPGFWGSAEKAQEKGYFIINFKGLTDRKAYSGKKSLKLDISLDKGPGPGKAHYSYWRGPNLNIPLSKNNPLYFSGYLYLSEVSEDVEVKLALSIRFKKAGKYFPGSSVILEYPMKVAGDWLLFQQADIYEFLKDIAVEKGYDRENILLEYWYISIIHKGVFRGQRVRVVFYIDDVKISSGKEEAIL